MHRILSFLVVCGLWLNAGAHLVTVDGNPVDWPMISPAQVNLGHICRNATSNGEYVWKDMPGDERTNFASPDTRVDLVEFRVTADQTNLYFMARMTDIDLAEGDGAPMVQVAIDLDRTSGSGTEWFGGFGNTQVDPNAEWEYLAITRFGSGNPNVILWQTGWIGPSFVGVEAIDINTETIEFAVPWNAMEVLAFPQWVRFTVATFRANPSDDAWDTGVSNALDAVTNYGDPGSTHNTWTEVSDGVINYYFDVWFDPDAEPFPPVLVVGALPDPNPPYPEPANEFVRFFNATPGPVDLSFYKIGDEESIGAGEGMHQFPSGASINPATVQILGNDSTAIATNYGITVDYDLSDMTQYLTWATGNINLSNGGDHVMILDGSDTVEDVVIYGSASYDGVAAIAAPSASTEIVRTPYTQDTNDCSVDFTTVYVPVELVSFSASAGEKVVELQWETASEEENLGFNIYRAESDQMDRTQINAELISGFGTTLEPRSYRYIDDSVAPGGSYLYWLEQVDYSGSSELFGPVSVEVPMTLPTALDLSVSPMPVIDGQAAIRLAVPAEGFVSMELYDLNGRIVGAIWKGEVKAGIVTVEWNARDLAPGAYMLRAATPVGTLASPFILR